MGILEEMDERISRLIAESRDIQFTSYLRQMQSRLISQKYQADLLKDELDRNYQIYLQRNPGVMQPESAVEQMPREEQVQESGVSQMDAQTERNAGGVKSHAEMMWEQAIVEPQSVPRMQEAVSQVQGQQTYAPVQSIPRTKKTSGEFKVGAIVLSMVGGVFILSALVMLGMHFMTGMLKGMCLYAVCALFFVLAEAFLYHRWQRLGGTISAISIGGIYVSTLVNYLSLHNFGMWVTLGIVAAVTLFVILWSRQRDSASYRTIGMFACMISFLFLDKEIASMDFLVITAIVFLIHLMSIFIPVKKHCKGFRIMYAAMNTLFTVFLLARVESFRLENYVLVVFWASSLAVLHLLYLTQIRRERRIAGTVEKKQSIAMTVTYGICATFYIGMIMDVLALIGAGDMELFWGIMGATAVISVLTWLVLRKVTAKWASYYFLNALLVVVSFAYAGEEIGCYCLLGALLVSKLLSLCKAKALYASEAILTTISCIAGLMYYDKKYGVMLMAGVLLGTLFIRSWSTYYEILSTFTLAFFAGYWVPSLLRLPVFMGVLFMGMLVFNYVGRWRGKGIRFFNVLVLVAQGICLLALINPIYRNAYITFLCMLVFGTATIVLALQEKFGMATKWRNIILAVFLTYMAFVFKTNMPVINSALLMIIALICVGLGFAEREKSVRVYGLVLSLLVCGKLALYDFFGTPTLQKTFVFLVVGVIALVIATIYMVLEKKNDSRGGME